MKVFYLTTILLCLFLNSFSQKNNFDSVNNYSYFLAGSNTLNKSYKSSDTPILTQGTGFFVTVDTSLYFITARHCLVFCSKNVRRMDMPDSMEIYLNDLSYRGLIIPTYWISDSMKCDNLNSDVDVFAYKINNLDNYPINFIKINKLENNFSSLNSKVNKLIMLGFPSSKNKILDGILQLKLPDTISSKKFEVKENFKYSYLQKDGTYDNGIDYLDYEIILRDYIVDSTLGGFSGTPVFIKETNNPKFEFLGIAVAGDIKHNSIIVAKKEYIIRKILEEYDKNH